MNGRLLMANQHVLEFVLLENRVVNVENCAARLAEHMFDALFGETAHDDIGAGDFGGHYKVLSRSIGN
jgi:hypothetical protein